MPFKEISKTKILTEVPCTQHSPSTVMERTPKRPIMWLMSLACSLITFPSMPQFAWQVLPSTKSFPLTQNNIDTQQNRKQLRIPMDPCSMNPENR